MAAALIVHGGCGRVESDSLPERQKGCRAAAQAGWRILAAGGDALDAVEVAIVVLEENPLFNAGRGSVLNIHGQVETDAALMRGSDRSAGAVAAVSGIRNPIRLARAIMEQSPHVMLTGPAAHDFARQYDVQECDPIDLVVQAQRSRWELDHGTVGCVAIDENGVLVAGTSTGGIYRKLPGRVGDSPLFGCGTFADRSAAVSCTGIGESIIRTVLAHTAAELATKHSAPRAAKLAMDFFSANADGDAGLILVDRGGKVGWARNSEHMPICVITADGVHTDV
jgi:beta-aspartyl-peptidase (threonine type)